MKITLTVAQAMAKTTNGTSLETLLLNLSQTDLNGLNTFLERAGANIRVSICDKELCSKETVFVIDGLVSKNGMYRMNRVHKYDLLISILLGITEKAFHEFDELTTQLSEEETALYYMPTSVLDYISQVGYKKLPLK